MSTNEIINEITDVVNVASSGSNPSGLSLEALALLINADRLKRLESKITTEFIELKKRQDQVTSLHKLIKSINAATIDNVFDCTDNQDIKDLLLKAKEDGVDIKDGKYKFDKDERNRLIENIRITADDHNTLNDMQLQTTTRLTTERYESYQLARSIMKPLDDEKKNIARGIAGK